MAVEAETLSYLQYQ